MHLRAFAFKKAEHIEVAIAFGELRPELANDLDHGLDARVINLNFTETLARLMHHAHKLRAVKMIDNLAGGVEKTCELGHAARRSGEPRRRAIENLESPAGLEKMAQLVHHIFNSLIRASRNQLEGADAITEVIEDIAQVEHIERA